MREVNYDEISAVYDDVRKSDAEEIKRFVEGAGLSDSSVILDIGCGTGNYTSMVRKATGARVYGVDSSEGMLKKAAEKSGDITFRIGSATEIPFDGNFFDFVYMTDVIHHVADIDGMFEEIRRVLKDGGIVCVSTQSHAQIDMRYTSEFFPSTVEVDKKRYPTIGYVKEAAESSGLAFVKEERINQGEDVEVGPEYLELVEKKGYSMLHLIPEEAYDKGLERLKDELGEGPITKKSAGSTLVWFRK